MKDSKVEKLTPEQEKERNMLFGSSNNNKKPITTNISNNKPSESNNVTTQKSKKNNGEDENLFVINTDNNEIDLLIGSETFGMDLTTEKRDFSDLTSLLEKFSDDPKVKDALEKGVDMREYTRQVEKELTQVEEAAISDYLQESDNFAELYNQIKGCDEILETMENLLGGFQRDLGSISSDINLLQEQSNTMAIKLKNRQTISKELSQFVQNVFIPEGLVKKICDEEISENYIEYLKELDKKVLFIDEKTGKENGDIKSCKDLIPEIDKMKFAATSKIRQFLLQMIYGLKKPRSNIQIVQQTIIKKYKYFIKFLNDHAPQAATEVLNVYTDTLSKIYTAYMKTYITNITKLRLIVAQKQDLIGTDEEKSKSWFGFKNTNKPTNVFTLGKRDAILTNIEGPAIVPHEVLEKDVKYAYDVLYRSINHYFIESASAEFIFISDFFSACDELTKGEQDTIFAGKLVISMFKPSIEMIKESITNFLNTTFDSVGLLLLLKISSLQKQMMHKRGMEFLDYFFEKIDNMVWPKWQQVVAANIESLKTHTNEPSNKVPELKPHYVTKKYADFICAILHISNNFKDFRIDEALNQLRSEVISLLKRLTNQINGKKDKIIFNVSNIDQVLSVLREKEIVSTETVMFEELMKKESSQFVDIELANFYPDLIKFVEETEPLIKQKSQLALDQNKVSTIASNFRDNWKRDVEALAKSILFHHFSNNVLGFEILKELLLKLSIYNKKFWDIIKTAFGSNALNKFYVADFMIIDEFKRWHKI
eukprot:TRINITY_DN8517_c0_g1_i1.p1 TRINITY_DN8517_c0_g1~~TRINITY_DN8517_c0_g1_i1.p1  ORF type:complete len:767 (-),score=247.53 TRINITY_DN8517_c0_g1_i1:17-2317(-)